jgi:hypothetical protein
VTWWSGWLHESGASPESAAMPRTVDVKLEPLIEKAFAPFGAVVGAGSRPPALEIDTLQTSKAPFEVAPPTDPGHRNCSTSASA